MIYLLFIEVFSFVKTQLESGGICNNPSTYYFYNNTYVTIVLMKMDTCCEKGEGERKGFFVFILQHPGQNGAVFKAP